MNGGPIPKAAFVAYSGRNQGPEFFITTPWADLAQTVIPKTLSINRPLEAIMLNWRGRVVIAAANYAAVAAEAPQTIIDRIRIFGTYKGAALTPVDLSGASCFMYARIFGPRGNTLIINGVRQAEPSIPTAQLLANFGNIGTYDLDIWYLIPTWPMVAPSARAQSVFRYFWQPGDWNDTLQVQLNFGQGNTTAAGVGGTSWGTPAGASTATMTAFGSGAGVPKVDIYTRYAIMGPLRDGFRSACVVRNEQSITQGIAAVANNVRLAVLAKQKTTTLIVKSGLILTGTAAGVNVFASLSDLLLNRTQILVDNRPIRANFDNRTFKEHAGLQFDSVNPGGYLNVPFCDSQTPRSAFRGDLPVVVAPSAQFELVTDIGTASADNRVNLIQEQIYADVDDPYWANTR